MSDRPTREQVDAWLARHTGGCDGPGVLCEACPIAAEVRALRDENVDLQEIALRVKLGQLEVWPDASQTELGKQYRAARFTIVRVESLLQLMAATARTCNCAERLDAVLKGP